MSDSTSFTSLLALVDSHLSKTKVQGIRSEDANSVTKRFPIPSLTTAVSDTHMSLSPGQKQLTPQVNDNSIKNVLAEQIANMLKAKEIRKQENEKKKLEEEMKKLKLEEIENDCVIDLTQALQTPYRSGPPVQLKDTVTSSSSCESLFEPTFINCDEEPVRSSTPEPLLPCITDMSSILQKKIYHGKCSAFGNILTSRMKPTAAPYFREKNESDIIRFDFKTKSPCDLIKEKLRKPTSYNTHSCDIINFI